MAIRVIEQCHLTCKRGLHDICALTHIVTRRTGRIMKMPVDIVDYEGTVVGTSLEEAEERVITKFIRCTCTCHGR